MIPKSFSQAQKLYRLSVNLSKTWISKYYPKNKYQFFGVPIEPAQAFSQHYFFSCLLEKQHLKDIWSQYPKTTSGNYRENLFHSLIKFFLKTTDILKNLLASTESIENLNERFQLVFLASGRHLQDQIPLIFYLAKKFKILVVGKIDGNSQKKLLRQRIKFLNVPNSSRFFTKLDRLRLVLKFAASSWQKQGQNQLLDNPLWSKRLWYLRLVQFPEIAALLEVAGKIFETAKPALLLTTSSNDTFGSAFSLIAKKLGITVAELQHGYTNFGTDAPFYQSDYQLVWGVISQKIRAKFSPKNAVVGCPFLKKPQIDSQIFDKSPRSKFRVLVLWTPPFGTISLFQSPRNRETFVRLIAGLNKLPDNFQIIFRSHPSYSLEEELQDLHWAKNFSLSHYQTAEEAVQNCDLVIGQPTTATFLAILYKKSLLFFNNSRITKKYSDPIVNSGSALNVPLSDLKKIDQYILRLLSDQNLIKKQRLAQEKFVREYCAYFGKESCEQIAKFAKKFVDEKSSSN